MQRKGKNTILIGYNFWTNSSCDCALCIRDTVDFVVSS